MKCKCLAFAVLTIVVAHSVSSHASDMVQVTQALPSRDANDDSSYAAGTRALNESRWQDAVVLFDQVINAKGKKGDGALYWKAYALSKLSKRDLTQATCMQLREQFRQSTWNKDCGALMLSSGSDVAHTDSNEDLRILALNSLLNRDPTQGIPLLRGVLTSNQSPSIKKHAIFVLAQSGSPDAQALIRDLIAGNGGSELQLHAIQAAAIFEGGRENDKLVGLYRSTTDLQIKRAVISALFISGDDTRLVELARTEKSMELKRAILSHLSLMQGSAAANYMMELLK